MKVDRTKGLTLIVFVAAVVAALTTLTVLCLRMRSKRISRKAYGDTIDYDLDDCCCGDFDRDDEDADSEEPVQASVAESDQDGFDTEIEVPDFDDETINEE